MAMMISAAAPMSPPAHAGLSRAADGTGPQDAADSTLSPAFSAQLQQGRALLQAAARQAGSLGAWLQALPAASAGSEAMDTAALLRSGSDRAMGDAMRSLSRFAQDIGIGIEPGEAPTDPSAMDASGLVWDSHSEFYAQIQQLLGLLQTEWLGKYQDAMAKFLEFYKEFSDIMEDLKVEGSGDKGDVTLHFGPVKARLQELAARYGLPSNALASFNTREQAEGFVASLGLPGLKVVPDGAGFAVQMDVTAVEQIAASMGNGSVTWDSARYNAWVSSKDSNMEQIKHVSKVLGEKLSEMTQKFDNIVKILSSTIDKITDADMSFVNGL